MMKQKKSFRSRIRQAFVTGLFATGLAFLLSAFSGCAGTEEIKKAPFKGNAETGIVSRYVVSSGSSLLNESYKNSVSLSKGPLSATALYHTERNSDREELDMWVSYRHGLTDKLNLTATAMTWQYPNKVLSKHNYFLTGGSVSYKGPVDLIAGAFHLYAHEGATDGETYFATASKRISLLEGKVSVCPGVTLGATRDMFGKSGLRHITPEISIVFGKGPVKLKGFYKSQKSLNNDTTDSFDYGGFSLSYDF